MKMTTLSVAALVAVHVAAGNACFAADDPQTVPQAWHETKAVVREDAKAVGTAVERDTKGVVTAVKKGAHEVAAASKQAAHAVAAAARSGTAKVKAAVKPAESH